MQKYEEKSYAKVVHSVFRLTYWNSTRKTVRRRS